MDTVKNLIDAVTGTDTTKQTFELTATDFMHGSVPSLRSRGMGVGDDIRLFIWVNDGWSAAIPILDDVIHFYNVTAIGKYAIDIDMAMSGPASCDLSSATMKL